MIWYGKIQQWIKTKAINKQTNTIYENERKNKTAGNQFLLDEWWVCERRLRELLGMIGGVECCWRRGEALPGRDRWVLPVWGLFSFTCGYVLLRPVLVLIRSVDFVCLVLGWRVNVL